MFVVVNGAESNLAPVLSGVPQGSILGPFLFLLHIDELSSTSFSCGSRLHLYADDVLLYSIIEANLAAFFMFRITSLGLLSGHLTILLR